MVKNVVKVILLLLLLAGVAYAAYLYLTKDDEFEEFEDELDFDDEFADQSLSDKLKYKAKQVYPF